MLTSKNLISSSSIHMDIKDHLNEIVSNYDNWIYYVFHAQDNLLTLPTLTIIGEGKIMDELIQQDWVNNSIELYNTIINVIEMDQLILDKKTPHNIYYNLNCQLDQIIFSETNNSYIDEIEYIQNNGEINFLKKTKKWFKVKQQEYLKFLDSYIINTDEDNLDRVFLIRRLQQLLQEVITDFKIIFCPMDGFLKNYSAEQTLIFILTYSRTFNTENHDDIYIGMDFYDFKKSPLSSKHLLSILNYQPLSKEENTLDVKILIENLRLLIVCTRASTSCE